MENDPADPEDDGPSEGEQLPEGKITEEGLQRLRDLIGVELRTERYTRAASVEALKQFAKGIGDLNPLFSEESYAQWTRWGGMIAHPCFPYVRHYPGRGRFGLPGVHNFFAGNEWRWRRAVKPGDVLSCTEKVTGVEVKESKLSKKLVLTKTMTVFYNQRDEVVAEVEGWSTRHERRAARHSGADTAERERKKAERHSYTREQLALVEEAALKESSQIRGANTLYFEDVSEGMEIPSIVRGPLSHMDITSYLIGVGRSRGAHGVLVREAQRHPAHYYRSAGSGSGLEYTGLGHMDEKVAARVGAPGTYDYGPQRISWLASLLTNWIGDLGMLVRMRADVRGFNVIGDVTWLKGRVTRKGQDGGRYLVDLEVRGENQLGEVTLPGSATVQLPARRVDNDGWASATRDV